MRGRHRRLTPSRNRSQPGPGCRLVVLRTPSAASTASRPEGFPTRDDDRTATGTAPAVAGRHVTLAVLALAVGGFAIGTTEFVTMGLLPQIADGVNVSIPQAGHIISAYALGVVVGAPLIAVFGARLPRRALLVWLMAACGAFNLLSAVAPSYDVLLVARFLDGLPHGAPTSVSPRWSRRPGSSRAGRVGRSPA